MKTIMKMLLIVCARLELIRNRSLELRCDDEMESVILSARNSMLGLLGAAF
jgi:hypothetical protein